MLLVSEWMQFAKQLFQRNHEKMGQIIYKAAELVGISVQFCLYDGHAVSLWGKSTRGVVADEPDSDSQGLHREVWVRRKDSEIVA